MIYYCPSNRCNPEPILKLLRKVDPVKWYRASRNSNNNLRVLERLRHEARLAGPDAHELILLQAPESIGQRLSSNMGNQCPLVVGQGVFSAARYGLTFDVPTWVVFNNNKLLRIAMVKHLIKTDYQIATNYGYLEIDLEASCSAEEFIKSWVGYREVESIDWTGRQALGNAKARSPSLDFDLDYIQDKLRLKPHRPIATAPRSLLITVHRRICG